MIKLIIEVWAIGYLITVGLLCQEIIQTTLLKWVEMLVINLIGWPFFIGAKIGEAIVALKIIAERVSR